MSGGGGPGGNKWQFLKIDGMTGQQIAGALSALAAAGFYNQVLGPIHACDGTFIFAGNYDQQYADAHKD